MAASEMRHSRQAHQEVDVFPPGSVCPRGYPESVEFAEIIIKILGFMHTLTNT